MAKCFIEDATLTAIGNAIRAKTGGTDLMIPSAMPAAIEGIIAGGGSGSYVWTKQGMSETVTEDTTGGTYTLTTSNDSRPSSEIEYTYTEPTYDSSKRQWVFADSTVVTVVNSDDILPSISGNIYCRVTSEPNVWYLVTSFNKGSSSPYMKNMAYNKKFTADVDWAKKYLTDTNEDKYPVDGWSLDGYYYKRVISDPNRIGGGDVWNNSNISTYDFYFIHYANGIWVAGSTEGLYYSTDGMTWTQSIVTSTTMYTAYYGNGIWVACSRGNGLYYSTDGMIWDQSNVTSSAFNSVYYANGIWVAGNSSRGLYYSTDGMIWTQSNISSRVFNSVYYANGIWVAGGSGNGLYYSTDGMTWDDNPIKSDSAFNSVYYANGIWVAGNNSRGLYYSTDGMIWDQSNVTISAFNSVYYANGIWVAGGTKGLYYSTDGMTWAQSDVTSTTIYTVYYANGIWVAGCYFYKDPNNCGLYYSTDGKTWAQSNIINDNIKYIYYANGIWVAGSYTYKGLYYSEGSLIEVDF